MPRLFDKTLLLLIVLFVLLRIGGLDVPYHQDETKWVRNAASGVASQTGLGHPPVAALIYSTTAKIVGQDWFRITPLIFGVLTLAGLYTFTRREFGEKTALWTGLLYSFSFYSVIGSLTIDTDGSILPFFFIMSLLFYFLWRQSRHEKARLLYGIGLLFFLGLGLLAKLSFVIVAGAFLIDYLWDYRQLMSKIKPAHIFKGVLIFTALLASLYLIIKFILPGFSFARTFSHAADFIKFSGRNYFQVLFQMLKAVFYASPLLVAPLFLKPSFNRKNRVLFLYIGLGLIFYLILFDFSSAALDKYFAFIAVPLSIISGSVLAQVFSNPSKNLRGPLGIGILLIIILSSFQFINHAVPPLYPKDEWLNRVFGFKWNFLTPFMGGSGPVGFYMSWLFIGLVWVSILILIIIRFRKPQLIYSAAVMAMVVGLGCNLFFIEEYQFGLINGNVRKLLDRAVETIQKDPNIRSVITYNDIGGYELTNIGKYHRRIYAIPKNEEGHRPLLREFKGYYLVIDIPRINSSSLYMRYFNTCETVYLDSSRAITASIYNCRRGVLE